MRILALTLGLSLSFNAGTAYAADTTRDLSMNARVEQAMQGQHRSAANIARNRYRHPIGTLEFFGLRHGITVMEIWPGGGWYTEIIAPALRNRGQFIVAGWDVSVPDQPGYRYRLQKAMEDKFAADPALYDQVRIQPFSPPQSASLGGANSVDLLLTFRNMHGWVGDGTASDMLTEFARVIKPGGHLGVVQHRAKPGTDPAKTAEKGYVSEAAIIQLAEAAGFKLAARSEVNANPQDSTEHPEGVWTLPPSLRLDDQDRDKYLAIGESDRMTLLFIKPDA